MPPPELALLAESLDPSRGGAERALRALARALAADGCAVWLYAPAARVGPPLPEPARVVPVPVAPGPRPLWALRVARRLNEAARADGARRVVACGKLLGADAYWPHGGVHRAARAASVGARASPGARARAAWGRRLRPAEWAYAWVEGRVHAACRAGGQRAIALSQRVRDDLVSLGGLAPEQVRVVRNGVEGFSPPDAAARREARRVLAARIGAPPGAPIALFCAHAFRLKGLDRLLAAAQRLPTLHVAVAGSGDPRPFLSAAGGLAQRLAFLGAVRQMAPLYAGASFLVHPSRYDPCSLVVLEALASGLPVVASAADGASELIRPGETGFVLARGAEEHELGPILERLLDPAVRDPLAEAAATFRRSWAQVGHELLAALA